MTKKRANGEGNIRKRKDGRWRGEVHGGAKRAGQAHLQKRFGAHSGRGKRKVGQSD